MVNEEASASGWQSGMNALQEGRVDEAIAQLSSFTSANPSSMEGNMFLGIALAQAGRAQEALPHLQRAIELQPGNAQAHYNLGLAQLALNQNDAAASSFTTALKLNPNYEAAQQALSQLSGTPVVETVYDLTFADGTKAIAFGMVGAIIGAVIWDKFVYYTNIQFGLVAVGVGFLAGMAVSIGAGGKSAPALQVIGALCAALGMLLGQALIINDYLTAELIKQGDAMPPFSLRIYASIMIMPGALTRDPLTLVFFAIGAYEGWKLPGRK